MSSPYENINKLWCFTSADESFRNEPRTIAGNGPWPLGMVWNGE